MFSGVIQRLINTTVFIKPLWGTYTHTHTHTHTYRCTRTTRAYALRACFFKSLSGCLHSNNLLLCKCCLVCLYGQFLKLNICFVTLECR